MAWRLVEVAVAADGALSYALRKDKLREVTRREGRYLLRSNLSAEDPAQIWRLYMLLVQVEEAFKNLKGDLAVRPIHHQLEQLSAIQMLDVHFPTTDGRTLIFSRYTMPDKLQKLLLAQLALELPGQTPPRITSKRSLEPLDQSLL